ncbi:unnamed protein product [Urochloa decumbens]|uniref:Uncharacterized protein n=1 Tax=Urochloa decumbens TaxID=240449 RepID=A0ABC9C5Q8_9POAL
MAASASLTMRRRRRGIADYYYDDDDGSSGTLPDDTDTGTDEEEEEEEEEDPRLNLGLHSMTAKGIQHLCSELLEIKKASDQDLRANVYLSYLSFIRMFHEAGDLDKDVHRLKRQVIAHRRLIQHLSSNCSSSFPPSSLTHYYYYYSEEEEEEEEEEADTDMGMGMGLDDELEVLVSEHRMEQALELVLQQQKQGKHEQVVVVAERLASVAGNPRTPRPELLKALSGLCKLGEAERANRLLFSWHRARRLPVAVASPAVKEVLSSIAGASRSLVALHGGQGQHHVHVHTPQLLRWAREEILEALPAYATHLKEVVRLLVAHSDGEQALGRFRVLPAAAAADYCLLTASGRKLVTLLQEVVDDVAWPLQRLGMDSAAVQLVADLFGEYLSSVLTMLLLIIPNKATQQVSVLINCTTLVSLLPTTIWPSGPAQAQAQVASLIKEAAGQVWSAFCHQFIKDCFLMVPVPVPEELLLPLPQGQQAQPSVCLQVVFLRVRRLKEAYGAILGGGDGTMRKLLQELMEAIINWLSTNPPESWTTTDQAQAQAQAQLDVHFLLEIARLGGFDVTASALALLADINIDDGDDHTHCAADAAVQLLLRHNITAATKEQEQVDAAEESSVSESSNDMASTKSTDEFVSIEDEDQEEKLIILGGSNQAAPQHSDKDAPTGRGRGRKKKPTAPVSTRPRWH